MGVAFLVILSAYGLAALGLVRLVAPRWPGLLPWLLLPSLPLPPEAWSACFSPSR